MKLVTFQANGERRLGVWLGENIFDLNLSHFFHLSAEEASRVKVETLGALEAVISSIISSMGRKAYRELPSDVIRFLQLGAPAMQLAKEITQRVSEVLPSEQPEEIFYRVEDVRLEAPIPRPGKLLCLAGNYAEHIKEGGREVAGKEKMVPRVFIKPGTTVIGHERPIVIPKNGNKIDWEAELAVVIGKEGKYITQDQAYDYVAGYTIINDVSERELIIDREREPSEWNEFFDWLNGKWMDTFAPMGPCLVTKDDIDDPHDLRITLKVNGEIKQDSSTGNMIFTIPEIIEFISHLVTLEPGDVISTGTPSGVGASTGQFLKPGDTVEVEIENIGVLRNTVEAEQC